MELLALLLIPYYMFVSRFYGADGLWRSAEPRAAWVKKPFSGLDTLMFIAPFVFVGFMAQSFWGMILSGLFAALVVKGHGQYLKFKPWDFRAEYNWGSFRRKLQEPEGLDVFVRPFFGKDPRTVSTDYSALIEYGPKKLVLRNFFGMAVTGMIAMVGLAGVLVYAGEPFAAGFVMLCGACKALAYYLGWYKRDKMRKLIPSWAEGFVYEETEIAEVLRGLFVGMALVIAIVTLL